VPTQGALLGAWRERKAAGNFYRLHEEVVQEHERKRPPGPSSYAKVRFRCAPSDTLTFASEARWPDNLTADHRRRVERAIQLAVVDALMGELYPYRGCAVTLLAVGWHDVDSSEAAFYYATKAALADLRATAEWRVVTAAPRGG
jgi:translation elongation factor EF-G